MSHSELKVEKRTVVGNQVRKLRRENIIPSVVYSSSIKPINIQIKIGEFIKVYKEAGKTHVIDLTIDGKVIPTIVQDLDINPITQQVRHVDFLAVNLKEKVTATVPVLLVGEARGVKENALVLTQNTKELQVIALPDNIPELIEVNVTDLFQIGDNISISDLLKSDSYEISEDGDLILASLVAQSIEIEESEQIVTPQDSDSQKKIETTK
ncbi:MAG: 50S ribosomal protein L25 [candidate division SR1 bacterium]|nr:50S ribosomal protein L25 [candidate division SR1 bacterium]